MKTIQRKPIVGIIYIKLTKSAEKNNNRFNLAILKSEMKSKLYFGNSLKDRWRSPVRSLGTGAWAQRSFWQEESVAFLFKQAALLGCILPWEI